MRKILLTIMAAVVSIAASAQLREDAFIIRTTGGSRIGYTFDMVEKITFSNLDDEGVPHSDVYYQELHFPDTVLRMPVTEIECVSFDKPVKKYQPDVILGTETGLFDYLRAFDEVERGVSRLTFDAATPPSLLPEVGKMLTYLAGDIEMLDGAYAGRVESVTAGDDGIVVVARWSGRIQDVFEEIKGVEAITMDTPGVREALRKAKEENENGQQAGVRMDEPLRGPRKMDFGEHTIPFDLFIGYEYEFGKNEDEDDYEWAPDNKVNASAGSKFSIGGGAKGEVELAVTFDFDWLNSYMLVNGTYEYQYYLKGELIAEASWVKLFRNPVEKPIFRVPIPSIGIVSVSLGWSPFVKLNGSAKVSLEKTFDPNKSRFYAEYDKGTYRSGKSCANHEPEDEGIDKSGGFELSFSLDGSFSFGIDLGLYIGTTRAVETTVGILADTYIGPKISGTIGAVASMQDGAGPNTTAYDRMKNWNATVTWTSVEIALSFYKELVGKKKKTSFGSWSFDLNPMSLRLLPEFKAPTWSLPDKELDFWGQSNSNPAKIAMASPEGTSLLPIIPGIAIYDEDDKFVESQYNVGKSYFWASQGDNDFKNMNWDFTNWRPGKKYKLYPAYKMLVFGNKDQEYRAEPAREVQITGKVKTESCKVNDNAYVNLYGSVDKEVLQCPSFENLGFLVCTDSASIKKDGYFIEGHRWSGEKDFSVGTSLLSSTTYYYCAAARIGNDYILGDVRSFTTGVRIYDGIDLHLPSGNIWARSDISVPMGEEYENFYTWGSWEHHPVYKEMVAQGWRLPTEDDFRELYDPNACKEDRSGTSTMAMFSPLDGGESLTFVGGYPQVAGGGSTHYWSSTIEDREWVDQEGNPHTDHLVWVLYASYGYHHMTTIDRDENHDKGKDNVRYYIKMVK